MTVCWEIDSSKQGQARLAWVTSAPEIYPLCQPGESDSQSRTGVLTSGLRRHLCSSFGAPRVCLEAGLLLCQHKHPRPRADGGAGLKEVFIFSYVNLL